METLVQKIVTEIKEHQVIGNDKFLIDGFCIEKLDNGNKINIEIILKKEVK